MKPIVALIVDDEVEVGEILSLRLSRRGMESVTASGCKAALKILAVQAIDVVVLDVKMPEIDGITTLKYIVDQFPAVSVIMLSGHADMDVATEGMRLGAFSYLIKPVDIDVLCHKIEDALRQKEFEGL